MLREITVIKTGLLVSSVRHVLSAASVCRRISRLSRAGEELSFKKK